MATFTQVSMQYRGNGSLKMGLNSGGGGGGWGLELLCRLVKTVNIMKYYNITNVHVLNV